MGTGLRQRVAWIGLGTALLAASALAPAAAAAPPTNATSPAASVYHWGWVLVRQTAIGTYTPDARDRGNSAGRANTVAISAHGKYNITMPGLADLGANGGGGIVNVSAIGGRRICTVEGWNGSTDIEIQVSCYRDDRTPAASKFSVSFLAVKNAEGRLGYALVGDAGGLFGTNYQYNSTGGSIVAARFSTGDYELKFKGLASNHGNVQVSPVIGHTFSPAGIGPNPNGPAICRATYWGAEVGDTVVDVKCKNTDGDPMNTWFNVTFTQGQGLKGYQHGKVAYLAADKPHQASYTPSVAYRYSSAGKAPNITRNAVGSYTVTLTGMPGSGALFLTGGGPHAGSTAPTHCVLAAPSGTTPQKVEVNCYNFDGALTDAPFSLSYEK